MLCRTDTSDQYDCAACFVESVTYNAAVDTGGYLSEQVRWRRQNLPTNSAIA